MNDSTEQIKTAEKGAILSISVYSFIAVGKLLTGYFFGARSLIADGFNNLTDVFSSIAVLYGLRKARKPADDDHPYGHWKAEPIASLVTSFVMLLVGSQVLISSVQTFINNKVSPPNSIASGIGILAFLLIMGVYAINRRLAQKVNSSGLKAISKDNLADALTSLITSLAIFTSSLGFAWIDSLMALLVGFIIIRTGIQIFMENSFLLSDGFHEDELMEYRQTIENIPGIDTVHQIKGRMYGANIYVDVTIGVDGLMSVQEGHDITEIVEKTLYDSYHVMYCDVHVEPNNLKNQFAPEQM